jgi:hypothetical protein
MARKIGLDRLLGPDGNRCRDLVLGMVVNRLLERLSCVGSRLWVTSSKTLTEHIFSELPQITDVVASSNNPSTARDLQGSNGPSPARHVRSLRGILEKICYQE